MSSTTLAVVVIVAVGVLALVLRRVSGGDAATAPRPDPGALDAKPGSGADPEDGWDDQRESGDDADEGGSDDGPHPAVADHPLPITSAGVAVVPFGRTIRLVTLHPEEEDAGWFDSSIAAGEVSSVRVDEQLDAGRRMGLGTDSLNPGDFTGARVRRDAEGVWRLETLGREGEFGYMSFQTEAAARTALDMFEHSEVVKRPIGEDGEPVPPSTEDFEEARRRFEETERELALASDDDEPPPANDWSSRR